MSNVYAVPFVGELGHELMFWQGLLRWVKFHRFKNLHMIVGCFKGHDILYEFADEIINLPEDFVSEEELNGQVCWRLNEREEDSFKWMKDQYNFNDRDIVYNPVVHSQVKYRHGYCDLWHKRHQQTFILLQSSDKGTKSAVDLLGDFDTWRLAKYIVVYPRFKRGIGIVTLRNWKYWKLLVPFLSTRYPDHKVVISGVEGLVDDEIRSLGIDGVVPVKNMDLDMQIALLGNAAFSVVPISGCTFLSLLSGCPTYIVGTEKLYHHVIYRNVFQTKMEYYYDTGVENDRMPEESGLADLYSTLGVFGDSCLDGRFIV